MKGSVRKRGEFWYYSFDAGKNKDGKRNRNIFKKIKIKFLFNPDIFVNSFTEYNFCISFSFILA